MSIITMNTKATTFFSDAMVEDLEMVLISMLDSGTLTEEQAMELNECRDLRTLRVTALALGLTEEVVHIVKVITGGYVNQPLVDGANVDLSEFFQCNTPAEAKALQSWADVFGVNIVPSLQVIEETKMTNEQAMKETSKQFRAIVEAADKINSSMINLSDIELKSSGSIATALVHALEKDGFYTQCLPNEEGQSTTSYVFLTKNHGFDNRMVAMLSVQLAGVLPFIDTEYPFDHVVNTAVFRRRFRDIARANQFIPGAYNNSMDSAGTTHWHEKLSNGLNLAIKAGLLEESDVDGARMIKHTKKYIGSCISRTSVMHMQDEISQDTRRKERVKTRSNARKDGTSAEVREALEFIESQGQVVNTWLLNALNGFEQYCIQENIKRPAVMNESRHVIYGCNEMAGWAVLHTEYFMDLRGRMYQFAHCGPNPQASDMAKALSYHTITESVAVGSIQHDMFMNEMFGEVCPEDSVWAQEIYIRRTAADPVKALVHAFQTNNGELPFKKFFTYMDMCCTWVQFQDTGVGISRLGFGPDAKCSGAQIFSILAGCETMAQACGLITGYTEKPADPYNMSAAKVNSITQALVDSGLIPSRTITRNEIKTPFMAIQYGGGVPSLRYKKFEPTMAALGIPEARRDDFCQDVVIEGINQAMGPTIGSFIECLRKTVAWYCEENDVDFFEHRHIDGFNCTKRGEANVCMTALPFIINYGTDGKGVIFGSKEKNTGWVVESRTSGPLQRANFIYYFPVHFIQGLDAVMARKIALGAKKLGLRGYTTIHDQFRTCLTDAPRLRSEVVPTVYMDMFVNNDPVSHLCKQLGVEMSWGNPLEGRKQVLTEEILFSTDAYYFE